MDVPVLRPEIVIDAIRDRLRADGLADRFAELVAEAVREEDLAANFGDWLVLYSQNVPLPANSGAAFRTGRSDRSAKKEIDRRP